jgi:glycosyltransferase involved in cell wall biosynthesis
MTKIGLDLRPTEKDFKEHFGRGTGRYTEEVVKEILKLSANDSTVNIRGLSSADFRFSALQRKFLELMPYGRATVATQLFLPKHLKSLDLDLIHFFAHGDAPSSKCVNYTVTVLDLIPLRLADLYKAEKPSWRFHLARFLENKAIQNAKGILAISECTKRDLMEILGVSANKIRVTPLACSDKFKPRKSVQYPQAKLEDFSFEISEVRNRLGFSETQPLLLYVGGIDARKNVGFMLEMFAELLKRFENDNQPRLLLAGRYDQDLNYPKLLEKISKLGIKDQVDLLGFVSDAQLIDLYHASDAVVFPSLYEGFGLPVLESMACGVPVVAGNNSSIPEVVGDVGQLMPDNDHFAWVKYLYEIISSREMQFQLSKDGLKQSKLFSWTRTAEETLAGLKFFAKKAL